MPKCPNCDRDISKGGHFVPPSLGEPGFFACKDFAEGETITSEARGEKLTAYQNGELLIPPDSIHLEGLELERAVQKEIFGGTVEWELQDMTSLLLEMSSRGFHIAISHIPGVEVSWLVLVSDKRILRQHVNCVREMSENLPAIALARGALAAVRQWPK